MTTAIDPDRVELVAALGLALSVRPTNWADTNDPEQRRAWIAVKSAWERATEKEWDR